MTHPALYLYFSSCFSLLPILFFAFSLRESRHFCVRPSSAALSLRFNFPRWNFTDTPVPRLRGANRIRTMLAAADDEKNSGSHHIIIINNSFNWDDDDSSRSNRCTSNYFFFGEQSIGGICRASSAPHWESPTLLDRFTTEWPQVSSSHESSSLFIYQSLLWGGLLAEPSSSRDRCFPPSHVHKFWHGSY